MIEPVLKDEALLADVRRHRGRNAAARLWWLGQSGFLLQWQDRHLLLDPYLSDSLTRKYADTNKPHVRMTARCVDPARLDFIDVVTSSHNHTDHFDPDTLGPLLAANPAMAIVLPAANRELGAQRLGIAADRLTPLDAGERVELAGFEIAAVPAAHEGLDRDPQGRYCYLGYVIRCGPYTLYHSGDTVAYDGMLDWLAQWRIDVALLPINGRDPRRGVPGNLDGSEAVTLARQAGIGCVVPCHYEMFQFNTLSPEAFVEAARCAGQPYALLRCGQGMDLQGR